MPYQIRDVENPKLHKAFNNIWSIIEDKKGSIWLGDIDEGEK
jgi:hypothetical protein